LSSFEVSTFQAFERAGWQAKATAYHAFYEPLTTPLIADLLDAAGVDATSRVLDVGSGPGYVLAAARRRRARAVGIDQAAAMAGLARRLSPDAEYLIGDAQRIPLANGAMSAVVGNLALHHLPEPDRALREYTRVLGPSGRLALTVWDAPSRAGRVQRQRGDGRRGDPIDRPGRAADGR